jgi:hypothetical protein
MRQWTKKTWAGIILATLALGIVSTVLLIRFGIKLNGLARLIGLLISGGTLALITLIRSEQIHFQDLYMRRMDHTIQTIDFYNMVVRPAMFAFIEAYDAVISDDLYAAVVRRKRTNTENFKVFQSQLAQRLELAGLLHLLDKLALLLTQSNYLYHNEVYHAIASEIARFIYNPKYMNPIKQMATQSSLQNLDRLFDDLKEEF